MPSPEFAIFDGHNDTLLRLHLAERGQARSFLERSEGGHLDLPRAQEAGLVGGFFAAFSPPGYPVERDIILTEAGYEIPMPAPPSLAEAQRLTTTLLARLWQLERASKGELKVVRTAQELERCTKTGVFAAVFHLEGAEAIDPELAMLEVLYQAGLRSLGPVWSRPNRFGTGVPFKIPSSPDTGPGLTDLGKELVRRCNALGVLVDVSHLNERGFWDVAAISDAPLVATHSNVHVLCPAARNLTDKQLAAVRESEGVVGVNFSVTELRADGYNEADTPLEVIVRHVDYLVGKLGVGGVAFGSDFDGATLPAELEDVTGLPRLITVLKRHGYDDKTLRKLCLENWLDVLRRSWKA
jgi:membrane dipeptidase